MKQHPTLGIIGGNGWLGSALGRAALAGGLIQAEALIVTGSRHGSRYDDWPGVIAADDAALIEKADVVVLSVRPEQFEALAAPLGDRLVISLMAGVSLAALHHATGSDRLVRAMPNAAAAIGRSWTPWCATPAVDARERAFVGTLLSTCGAVEAFEDEAHIDYLTALTGSGPAFPALLAEALIDHARAQGIEASVAQRAVLESLAGSLALMREDESAPGDVVKRFLDYGGVTTEGLNAMIEGGLREAVSQGVSAAHRAARPDSRQ